MPVLELLQSVGQRAKTLRQQAGYTLDELSARSGVSRRMIALVEAGEANASLATLDKLARALGTDFATLVSERPLDPLVAESAGDVLPVWEDGQGSNARLLAAYKETAGTELWRWELAPHARYQAEADPPGSEELILVSAGRLVVEVENDRFDLGPGGYLRLPSDREYAYMNVGGDVATFVRVVTAPSTKATALRKPPPAPN
ncbi:MAG TPA: XRE family transcriptional regulator [Acidimicrobiales bacterium]|nr:XRE family transcriptional regulator [Acidimicrobiales bacterium]